MGRNRYRMLDPAAPQFVTCTVLNWIPLFTRPATAAIVPDTLRWRQEHSGWRIYGYVILENHLHLIADGGDFARELPRFKSYTARHLIDCLEEARAERVLKQLAFFRKAHKDDRQYQCWEEGSHPVLMANEEMLRERLEHIHRNPVQRGYVDDPVHWRYSSARNYAGLPGLIPVFTGWA